MTRFKLSGPAFLVAFLVSLPALRHAFIDHTLSMQNALIRVGLAILFGIVAVAVISSVIDAYRLQNILRRRKTDFAAAVKRRADDESAH
jgi:hypothetical protein